MCSNNEILAFTKFFILLICTGGIVFLYVNNRQNHPPCLWNGATVYSLLNNGTIDKQNKCKFGSCDKQICDYIYTPGILTVSIELPPFPPSPPKIVTEDYIWFVVFGILFLIIVMDFINICCIICSKVKENKQNYETLVDSEEERWIVG
jgi:hypothetical protein